MKLGDLYIHKEKRNIIEIESYASHIKEVNPFTTIVVFANICKSMGTYGSCPSFNGYGTVEEIEKEYELAIPQEKLIEYSSFDEVIDYLIENLGAEI